MKKKGISFWNPITNGQHANSILKSFRYFKLRFCYDIRQQSFIVIKISSKYKMRELYYPKSTRFYPICSLRTIKKRFSAF